MARVRGKNEIEDSRLTRERNEPQGFALRYNRLERAPKPALTGDWAMIKRGWQLAALLCALTALAVVAGGPHVRAQAQAAADADQPLYTYVALWDVPRPDWGDIEKFYKDARPTLDKLVKAGTLAGYGNARTWIHDGGGFTHANWITAASFADIYSALETIREAVPQPAAFSKAKHMDEMVRSTIHGGKAGASGTGMLWIAQFSTKPGQMGEFTQLFDSQIRPLFDEQVAAGSILAYWLNFHAVHTGDPGSISLVYLLPNAAAIDKFQAALAANEAKNPELGAAMMATMEFAQHRDTVFEVLSFAQK
jgi:hypothetical protein